MDQLAWHVFRFTPQAVSSEAGSGLAWAGEVWRFPSVPLDVFVPMRHERWFNRRQRVSRSRKVPAFPGYGFVRCPVGARVSGSKKAGFRGLLRNADGSPAIVSDDVIGCIRAASDAGAFDDVPGAASVRATPVRAGDPVKFRAGSPLEGLVAVVRGFSSGYAELDVNARGKTSRVKARPGHLVAA